MPQYDVTAPTGQTFTVTAPAGASEAEIMAYAKAQFAAMESKRAQEEEDIRNAPAEDAGMLDAAMIGAGREMTQLGRGVKDLFVDPSKQDLEDRKFEAEAFDRLRRARPVSTGIGEALPAMTAGGLAGVGRGVLGTMGRQALAGGAVAAAKPGTMEQRAQAGLTEGALAGGLTGVVGGLGRMGQQALRPEVTALREAGVTPTVGQTLGGWANTAEQKLTAVPGVGDAIKWARNRAMDDWQRAEFNRAVAPAGARLDEIGAPGVQRAQRIKDAAYDEMRAAAPGGIVPDQQMTQELDTLRQMIRTNAKEDVVKEFEKFYRGNLVRRQGNAVGFDVSNYKQLDSDIGKKIAEASDPETKSAFSELLRIMRDGAGRHNPAYEAARKKADAIHARLANIEKATTVAPGQTGNMTPTQLLRAQRNADKSARNNRFAAGRAPGQGFTTAAQNVLGERVPDSGTAGRLFLGGGLAGASAFEPTVLAATAGLGIGGGIGATRTAQAGMNAGLRGVGTVAPNIPPWLSQMLDVETDQP